MEKVLFTILLCITCTHALWAWEGKGTANDPWLIQNLDDWITFCEQCKTHAYFLPMPVTPPLFGKDGIIVTYQQYEIAAYAAGMPSFVIPYNKAKGLLNQTGKALL